MRKFVIGLSPATVRWFFGSLYALALLFAVFPPLYLWGSGSDFLILGVPFAVVYWIIDALLVGIAFLGLYLVEMVRGELDEEVPA